MKRLLFSLMLLSACSSEHALVRTQPNRLIYQSRDLFQTDSLSQYVRVRPGFFRASGLVAKLPNRTRKHIPTGAAWGYSDRKGLVYRYYRGDSYQLVSVGEMMVYNQKLYDPITPTLTAYSRTLDEPITRNRNRAK